MPGASFPKRLRLRKGTEFDRVFAAGNSVRGGAVRVFGCSYDGGVTRLGLAVSRRVGNAVARNRWKRSVREAFRLSYAHLPAGLDLVVIPTRSEPPPIGDLRRSLVHLAGRIQRRIEGTDR